jgi:threonine/homoserine/homoserine lactone efflux protein
MIYILISITLLAAMSPGPDFIVVMKNAIYGKKQ